MAETRRIMARIPVDLYEEFENLFADSFWGSHRAAVEQAIRLYLTIKKDAAKGQAWAVALLNEVGQ
jgi:metal-responsive CopG/Arc/MetJ family transcriptional regulator